ncbi:MAG: Hsp20/alpha crystallin family protein [Deltaproteobacteria bacterium]
MTELIVWKNREMDRMRREVDRLFNRMWGDFGSSLSSGPCMDISETKDVVIIRVELPGVDSNDVQISVTDRTLYLSGEKRAKKVMRGEQFYRVERRYGSFSRKIDLPCSVEVEEIKATYENGVLMIVMPKCKDRNGSRVEVKTV